MKASELILNNYVLVNGSIATKPSRQVQPGDELLVRFKEKFVSRGGLKLEGALSAFGIEPKGLRVLDAGSSTGGFTDCLLQNGAARVYAIDVGTNQLHEKLRGDDRVVSIERTNLKEFEDPEGLGFELIVGDLSFVSLTQLSGKLVSLAMPGASIVILVKPQFEVGYKDASRSKGVIKDSNLWRSSLIKVGESFLEADSSIVDLATSNIKGTQGNVEFFYHVVKKMNFGDVKLEDLVDFELRKLGSSDISQLPYRSS